MEITNKIASYEDACKELGLNPENLPVVDTLPEKDRNSIISYYKLIVIIRALNQGWEADFSNHNQRKYWNYFWVDTAGFGCAYTNYAAARAGANVGSRLCFEKYEIAKYARETFKSLYEQFLYIK
jgi:hypothetical protein